MAQQLHGTNAGTVGTQPKISPYLTFVSANTATYNTSGTVQRQAASAPIIPPPVSAGLLNAVYDPGMGITLTLLTAPYLTRVLVYGAAPVPVRQNIYKKKGAFKLLGGLNSLAASSDLFAFYNAKFRCTGGGSKIAIKLVGVSAPGIRTAELFISGITSAAAVGAAAPADTNSDTGSSTALKVA